MAVSTKLAEECPYCKKKAVEVSRMRLGENTVLVKLKCGHTVQTAHVRELTARERLKDLVSRTKGHRPYEYQVEGVEFAEKSGIRCLIADEMGLGKTIQAIGTIFTHPEICPLVWVTKSGLKFQALHEIYEWLGPDFPAFPIDDAKFPVFPGFKLYIVGYDTLWRMKDDAFDKVNPKCVVIDECQYIKNTDASRTKGVQTLAAKVNHIVALSGTPIKNNVVEYFNILNMLDPIQFHTKTQYVDQYVDYEMNGQTMSVKGLLDPEKFKRDTSHIIIRRTRAEAAPNLPKIRRMYQHSEITDPRMARAYANLQEEFEAFYKEAVISGTDSGFKFASSLMGFYSRMRHLTSLVKIPSTVEFVMDFLTENPDEKIVIFGHHVETLHLLFDAMKEWHRGTGWGDPLLLHASVQKNDYEKFDVVKRFEHGKHRVLLCGQLASGEGLNLQFCQNAVMHERQWNPANEEQCEARFPRPGSTASVVNITYAIAVGTIDEFLTELVEAKRAQYAQALDGKNIQWNENELVVELARHIMEKRKGQKWMRR